ncbi:MAG: poly(3-hydroxyalkanoate) synthetase, partial [Gemmatimonadales bacterium]|nr:poly(3-hydroxyalkanoate) synthetase [Gemmatimonadales bacterium]
MTGITPSRSKAAARQMVRKPTKKGELKTAEVVNLQPISETEQSPRARSIAQSPAVPVPVSPGEYVDYQRDVLERAILFWDTLRERANNMIAHERA